jgi:hypothetical protein
MVNAFEHRDGVFAINRDVVWVDAIEAVHAVEQVIRAGRDAPSDGQDPNVVEALGEVFMPGFDGIWIQKARDRLNGHYRRVLARRNESADAQRAVGGA